MRRSSTITSRAAASARRFIQSNTLTAQEPGRIRPTATSWSGLTSITHHTIGTRRIAAATAPKNPMNGGLVLTSRQATREWNRTRGNACATNSSCAASRMTILPFPKLESGSRRTSTPARDSREIYRTVGSSYPRLAVYTVTRHPRRTIASATSARC